MYNKFSSLQGATFKNSDLIELLKYVSMRVDFKYKNMDEVDETLKILITCWESLEKIDEPRQKIKNQYFEFFKEKSENGPKYLEVMLEALLEVKKLCGF